MVEERGLSRNREPLIYWRFDGRICPSFDQMESYISKFEIIRKNRGDLDDRTFIVNI